MNYQFRFFIAFIIFFISGLISAIPKEWMYTGVSVGIPIFPVALLFGVAYIISHIVFVNENILSKRLLKSFIFVILGTQIAYYAAFMAVGITHNMKEFSYLFGNIVGAFTIFLFWLTLSQTKKVFPVLMKILFAGCIAFLITSISGFHKENFILLPNSMATLFISWHTLIGMTLLHAAKTKHTADISSVNTKN